MSERYSKLFSLTENLYTAGSPVVIAAGALLKDNQTGKVLAQLKLRSISGKTVKAATVLVSPLDTVGKPLGEPVAYQYLDLHADRDGDFGQKAPIALPDAATRSFTVSVTEVIFADNSIWDGTGSAWKPLNRPKSLDTLSDGELAKQFRIEYGSGCDNLLLEQEDLWNCVCGALNHREEACCHKCGKALAELQAIDMEDLRKKKDQRVAQERAETEAAQKEAEIAAAKTKKIGKIVAILTIIIAVGIYVATTVSKNLDYNQAIILLEDGQYNEAAQFFAKLGNYKDSAARGEETFIQLMHTSIRKASKWSDLLIDPSDETKKLLVICEEFEPYCGSFSWEMETLTPGAYCFDSDFYVDGDSVYWVYDDSEYTRIPSLSTEYFNPELGRDGEMYDFLRNPLLVEDATVYERVPDDLVDLKAIFKNDQIKLTMGGFAFVKTDNGISILEDRHSDVFTLEGIKTGE